MMPQEIFEKFTGIVDVEHHVIYQDGLSPYDLPDEFRGKLEFPDEWLRGRTIRKVDSYSLPVSHWLKFKLRPRVLFANYEDCTCFDYTIVKAFFFTEEYAQTTEAREFMFDVQFKQSCVSRFLPAPTLITRNSANEWKVAEA